jgi:hypothetical protein
MAKARDYIPALKYGHKIYPEDIAGMLGLPYVGTIYYVDPFAGNDTANSGLEQNDALLTVAAAYAKCTSGKHDVVIIAPSGGTGRTVEGSAITWGKRFTHLIGSAAPISANVRAGMSFTATGATTTPQFLLTENGCIIKNVTFKQAVADSYALVSITGDYNYFDGVHFQGIGNATAGDSANGYDVLMTGASENVFVNCTFGDANVARSAANACLKVASGCSMNRFQGCVFQTWADNVGVLHVNFTGTALDRWVIFDHCAFLNGGTNSGGTELTVFMNSNGTMGGTVFMWDSWVSGGAAVADDFTQFKAAGAMTQPTGAAAGESILMA